MNLSQHITSLLLVLPLFVADHVSAQENTVATDRGRAGRALQCHGRRQLDDQHELDE